VRVERDGDVAVVVLDAPPLNLFDETVFAGFEAAVAELVPLTAPGRPDRARAVLLEARGRVVSAGVDVHAFAEIAEGPDPVGQGTALWGRLIRVAQTLEELPVPTVFAAHGLTLTAAFELALACDLLVAAERASFGLVEIVVGLTPSMGGPQRLAERAGPARAKELVYTGERYPAAVLERWGVVNQVLPDDGFAGAARAFAARLAAGPTVAHAATKRLVGTSVRDGVRAADAITAQVSGPLFATADLRGAVRSFLDEGPGKARYEGR
jgi:enoyl-CoA hydratase/carnithine racemase